MVKHVVLFKIKEEIPQDEKQIIMTTFKEGIMALPDIIPCIKSINVGFNINPDEQWDICLDSTFDTLDDARFYSTHPSHVDVHALTSTYRLISSARYLLLIQ